MKDSLANAVFEVRRETVGEAGNLGVDAVGRHVELAAQIRAEQLPPLLQAGCLTAAGGRQTDSACGTVDQIAVRESAKHHRRPRNTPVVGPRGVLHAGRDLDLLVASNDGPLTRGPPAREDRRASPVEVGEDLARVDVADGRVEDARRRGVVCRGMRVAWDLRATAAPCATSKRPPPTIPRAPAAAPKRLARVMPRRPSLCSPYEQNSRD